MKTKKMKSISAITLAALLSVSAVGCSKAQVGSGDAAATTQIVTSTVSSSATSTAEASVLDTSELFSDRDLE